MSIGVAGEMLDGAHFLPIRVYYEDTDFYGVVYHASYLRFMERGRTEYLRALGIDHRALFAPTGEGPATAFVVRSMQIEFLKPARIDDVLDVCTETRELRGASIVMRQRVMRGPQPLVDADVRVALVSGGKAVRIPASLRAALSPAGIAVDGHGPLM